MKETQFRKNGKMTAEQERKTHKKAEIESFQERKNKTKENKTKENKTKENKTKGGIYDV